MSDVNANISVNIDTSAALGELKNLQRQISLFHNQIAKSSASAAIAQRNLQQEFVNSINATGQFAARMQTIKTSAESFTTSLEKNKFSMREYFRYGVASSKSFGKVFKTEFETINKVAEERVRKLQTQYIKMGRDASGAMKAIAVTPLALDMENLGTKTMMAAQKQQLFNQLLAQGTTNLVNFGKNTQWAGRQLMVGFTIPLSIFGSTASKVFMDLEKQVIRFKRVYGDLFTLPSETEANLTVIRGLASEFTKYGVAIADTMSIAADAAAAGFSGRKLEEQVKAATKLSILGEVDKQQALSATIAMQTAFKMNSDQLAESINFLNAVENQSVVSLQNLTDAIPRVAPVIQGLGGDIKDMSVFLAAMQEGGVNAAEAANGLKSALASIINPSKAAKEMLASVNIDLNAITTRNEGNVMRTVLDLADAMKELTPLARQRILEQLFGKFQFARVSALFDNIAKSGSQAANALELAKMSSQDLAAIANKELGAIEENTVTKFKASIEALRESIAPVGESFLKVVTPIIELFTKVADKFNNLSDGTKKVVTTLVTLFAGVGPVVLMLVGLIANFGGQMLKLFGLIRNGYLRLSGQSKFLGEQTQYLTSEQMQAEAVAHSLDQVHARLTQRFTVEADAVNNLRNAYLSAAAASERFAFNNPGMMIPQSRQPKRYAEGGVISGPGTGTSDSIIARVSNGEAIIPAASVARNPDLVNALVSNNIPGFASGKNPTTGTVLGGTFRSRQYSPVAMMAPGNTPGGFGMDREWLLMNEEAKASFAASVKTAMMMEQGIRATQANYRKFGENLAPTLDTIFDIFKQGVTDDVTNISQVGQTQYPLIIQSLEQMAANGQLAASDLKSMSVAVRKLLAPLESDLTQQNIQRVELAVNDAGENFVKRASTERFGLSYKDQIKKSFSSELAMRGIAQPADYPGSYQFAHIPYSAPTEKYVEPFLRKKAGAGSAIEQQVLQQLKNGAIFKEGQILIEQQAMQVGRVAVGAVAKGAGTASPSHFTDQTGQDIDNGLIIGMEKRSGAVAAAAAKVANGAVTQFEQTASGLLIPAGSGNNSGMSGLPEGFTPTSGISDTMIGPMPKQSLRGKLGKAYKNFKQQPIKQKASTISGGAMRGGMVASGAMMAASMLPGPMGQIAQQAAPVVMGLQSLAMALPLLTNPVGLAVAGVAAVAAGFFFLKKKQDEYVKSLQDAGKKEAEARLGNIESIQAYSRYVGDKALPSERQFNRVGDKRFIDADLAKAANFRKFYSEEGKTIGNQLSGRMGKANALDVSARDVAQRAASFGLGPADIAANIKAAAELSGVSEIKLKGKVQELLNKDGKDITKEPLTLDARINYLSKASESSLSVIQRKIDQIKPPQLQTDANGNVDYYGYNAEVQKSKETQIKNTKFATVGLTLALEDQKNSLAILNGMYVDGKITVDQYNAAYEAQMVNFRNIKKATDDLVKSLDKVDPSGKASQAAIEDMADQTFKGLEKTNKKVAKLLKTTVTKSLPKNMRTEVLIAYANGSLSATDILQLDSILSEMKGKTYEQKVKFVGDLTGLSDALQAQLDYSLATENLRIAQEKYRKAKERGSTALEKYKKNLDNAKGSVEKLKKAIESGGKVTKDSPEVPGGKSVSEGGGAADKPYAFVDDLLKKLKLVRNNSIDATKGVKGFIAALKGDMKGFKGTDELLRAGGATQGFIDIVGGLDAVTFKKIEKRLFTFTKDGKLKFGDLGSAIQKFTKEVELGSFVDQQQQVVKNADQQMTAYTKLKNAGVSATKITEILGNEALTTAVAAEKVGSTDWKNFIAGAKSATKGVTELGKVLKINAFLADQEQETSTDKMNEYFAAQEAIIRQQARTDFKNLRGYTPEQYEEVIAKQQESVDLAQKAVEEEQAKIDKIQEEVALYNRGLELIGREEEVINKSYETRTKAIDDQISALEDVKKVNQQLIDQQKQQTDLAGALSSGDIGAAARIAQEMRAGAAQNSQQALIDNLGKNKTALELQKQKDIEAIQVQINGQYYTRTQLQDLIVKKEDEIYLIENTTLKSLQDKAKTQETILGDMQRIIDKYNKDMTTAINNVTNATGQTKAEWEAVNAVIDTTADWLGDEHLLGLTDDVANGTLKIEDAWKKVLAAIKAASDAAAAFGAGANVKANTTPTGSPTAAPTQLNAAQQEIAKTQISAVQSLVKSGQVDKAESATVAMMKEIAAVKPIAAQDVVAMRKAALGYLSTGGLVPKYFAAGGFARGSDTVPAMLTPGEFVMSKYAVNQHGLGTMKAINNGQEVGGAVYTYNLSVNVKSDANPNDIARTVMAQIKQIDSQRLRGVRQ
jgi:TP901 family phage tail tape measure protein